MVKRTAMAVETTFNGDDKYVCFPCPTGSVLDLWTSCLVAFSVWFVLPDRSRHARFGIVMLYHYQLKTSYNKVTSQ
jgi:hypothetical protein